MKYSKSMITVELLTELFGKDVKAKVKSRVGSNDVRGKIAFGRESLPYLKSESGDVWFGEILEIEVLDEPATQQGELSSEEITKAGEIHFFLSTDPTVAIFSLFSSPLTEKERVIARRIVECWNAYDLLKQKNEELSSANVALYKSMQSHIDDKMQYKKKAEMHDDLLRTLEQAREYVAGAYECAFPDEGQNDAVLANIDELLKKAQE